MVVAVGLFSLFLFDSFALSLDMCDSIHSLIPWTLPYLLVGRRDHGLAPIISNAATAKPLPTWINVDEIQEVQLCRSAMISHACGIYT